MFAISYSIRRFALCCVVFLTFLSVQAFAQKDNIHGEELKMAVKPAFSFPEIKNFDGTYQFVLSEKRNVSVHTYLLDLIEKSRKKDEDVVLELSTYCKVIVPSENRIKSSDFTPFNQPFKISEK